MSVSRPCSTSGVRRVLYVLGVALAGGAGYLVGKPHDAASWGRFALAIFAVSPVCVVLMSYRDLRGKRP